VDDDEAILSALGRSLHGEPYDLLLTKQPVEALRWLRHRHIHLLIADQRMPGMLGTELLKATQSTSPGTLRMMITAYADIDAVTRAINDAGIHHFVRKPWDNESLKTAIRSLLFRREHLEKEDGATISVLPTASMVPPSATKSDPSVLRIDCHGKSAGEVMSQIDLTHLGLEYTQDEVVIVLEDLMSLDDSVLALLSHLVRTIFKSGTRVAFHLKLKRGHFGA
jgi:DNA-binding response OmpR family regulator